MQFKCNLNAILKVDYFITLEFDPTCTSRHVRTRSRVHQSPAARGSRVLREVEQHVRPRNRPIVASQPPQEPLVPNSSTERVEPVEHRRSQA